MTNEKDIDALLRRLVETPAGERIRMTCGAADLRSVVTDLSTTIRKEEREAAFKVICVDCAEGDTPILDEQARWYYHGEGNDAVGCSASKLRIEAATTKGGNGG